MGGKNIMELKPFNRRLITDEKFHELIRETYTHVRKNFEEYELKINFDYFIDQLHLDDEIELQIVNKKKIKEVQLLFKCENRYIMEVFVYDKDKFRSEYALQDIFKEVVKYLNYELGEEDA